MTKTIELNEQQAQFISLLLEEIVLVNSDYSNSTKTIAKQIIRQLEN